MELTVPFVHLVWKVRELATQIDVKDVDDETLFAGLEPSLYEYVLDNH